MWGPYTTEDQGRLLRVFGTEQGLRYRIPFHEVDEVIEYLREHATEAGERVGTMGDDGEKFGAWPTTYEHCWGKGRWVERFFEALESNADWLTTVRPSDWLATNPPVGRVYVPTGSYAEMGEWALPPDESRAFAEALHHARETGAPEARWLRGAFWRNFQVKYREINDLHKQMLRVSEQVDAMPPGAARDRALDHLYRGQSNDCYWHGLFGGIYIAHMRAATLAHLIAAEDARRSSARDARRAASSRTSTSTAATRSASRPTARSSRSISTRAAASARGTSGPRATRSTAVLRRRPEAYHETPARARGAGRAGGEAAARRARRTRARLPRSTTSVQVKEPGLAARLVYDDYERRSGLIRILPARRARRRTWGAGGRRRARRLRGRARSGSSASTGPGRHRHATARPRSTGARSRSRSQTEVRLGGGRLDPTLALDGDDRATSATDRSRRGSGSSGR